jgi:hypothetical protein
MSFVNFDYLTFAGDKCLCASALDRSQYFWIVVIATGDEAFNPGAVQARLSQIYPGS